MPDSNRDISAWWLIGLWLVLVVVASAMSGPIVAAWMHDPSLRLGAFVFLLWMIAVAVHWQFPMDAWPWHRMGNAAFAAGALVLGILGELQALVYLGCAFLLALPVEKGLLRVSLGFAGVLWMPLWAWSAGPYLGSALNLVSLGLAVILLLVSLVLRLAL